MYETRLTLFEIWIVAMSKHVKKISKLKLCFNCVNKQRKGGECSELNALSLTYLVTLLAIYAPLITQEEFPQEKQAALFRNLSRRHQAN